MHRLALSLLGLATAVAGCKDTAAPGCRIAQSSSLPATALTLTPDVTLQRAGAGLALVGVTGDEVRWAPLAIDGTLGAESKLTLPQRQARPGVVFATTAKSSPGDQLIAAYVAPKAGVPSQLQIVAIAQTTGGAAGAPTVLADLPTGVDPNIVRLAMGPSQTGKRALLTWNFDGQDAPPSFLILGPDGQPQGMPAPVINGPVPHGTCLSVVSSRTDFAVSLTENAPSAQPAPAVAWHAFELRDDGGHGTNITMVLGHALVGCISAAPTPLGYVLAYQNNDGTYFADFNVNAGTLNEDIVAGVLQFGGVAKQPQIACISPMGSEYSLLFDRSSGPEVWRFNAFGTPQGSSLFLPTSAGQIGPLSALPGQNAFLATYLDQGKAGTGASTDGNASGNSRYLIRVDCPMATPLYVPDASTADAADAGAVPMDAAMGEAGK
jgi:hypothetical protein